MGLVNTAMQIIKQHLIDQLFNNLDNLELCYQIIDQFTSNGLNQYGMNIPAIIACTNNLTLINYAFKKLKLNFNLTDEYGYTALHLAAKFNHLIACQFIIETKQVDINQKTLSGYSPLMCAAALANLKLIKLFISSGANIFLLSNSGKNILYYAQNNTNENVKAYLQQLMVKKPIS